MELYPFKLAPAYKDYIWGGQKLSQNYGKHSGLARTAESWELSCHKDGPSTIAGGPLAGKTLSAWLAETGKAALGRNCEKFQEFPVLVKLIDACNNLSVQVHPDNEYALAHEGEYGKTEMWYIVGCEPGASLLYGFNREISKEEFRRRIEDNTLLSVLRSVPVHKGDVFFIEAGTIHAIGKGILIAEIQQNSNSTYRVYDYGRLGADGKPRPLHIEKAVDVAVTAPATPPAEAPAETLDGCVRKRLARCPYFCVTLYDISSRAALRATDATFHSFTCVEGALFLRAPGASFAVQAGDTVFVPAGLGDYSLEGTGKILLTTVE